MIKKLASYIKEYKVYSILAPITVAIEVAFEVAIPFIVKFIIDNGIKKGNTDIIIKYGIITIVLAMLSLVFGIMSAVFASKASTGFIANLRRAIFDKVLDFSFRNIDKFSTASLITRETTDLNFIQNAFMMIIRVAVRAPLMFVSSLVMVMIINAKLALVFVAVIPLMVLAAVVLFKRAIPIFEALFKVFDKMNAKIQENLIAIRTVKAFVRESHETEEFRKASKGVLDSHVKAEKTMVLALPLFQFSIYATMIAIIWFGGKMVINPSSSMTDGDFLSFIQYINMILMSFMIISMVIINIVFSRASAKRVIEVLEETPDISDADADEALTVKDGSVEFDNVCFDYNNNMDNPLIAGLNLSIKSGQTVGIIGGTGSGKSTLSQLITRFYDVSDGEIRVGGENVKKYKLKELRSSVAMVLQKNTLFSGTIKQNLQWGNHDATNEDLDTATKIAAAYDFINSFPKGYDTMVEQGGTNLSGGQKQRLCIARALIKKPKIMILDDSTSAVDTATDLSIRQGLKSKLANTTVLIIAQRIASVIDCDKIIVMNEGKIEAVGTHDELLKSNDIYLEIYESQSKAIETA